MKTQENILKKPYLTRRWITPNTRPILHREYIRLQVEENYPPDEAQQIVEDLMFAAAEDRLRKKLKYREIELMLSAAEDRLRK